MPELALFRVGPLGVRHLRRHLDRFEDAAEVALGLEVGVTAVARAPALQERVALGLHVLYLRVYVLYEVAEVVQAFAVLVEELLVGVRSLDRLDQLVHHRAKLGKGEPHRVALLLAAERHPSYPVRAEGVGRPRPDPQLVRVALHRPVQVAHDHGHLVDRSDAASVSRHEFLLFPTPLPRRVPTLRPIPPIHTIITIVAPNRADGKDRYMVCRETMRCPKRPYSPSCLETALFRNYLARRQAR